MKTSICRIAILWKHVTGYLQAGLRALLADEAVQLLLIQNRYEANAQFAPFQHPRCQFLDIGSTLSNNTSWLEVVDQFQPQLALISGNKDVQYLQAAAQVQQQGGITVWASDRVLRVPLQDSYQIMQGRLLRRWQHFDAAFVPGYAANLYAQAIGFASDRIFQGLYTCDTGLYCPIGQSRHQDGAAIMPPVFLYVGQFIKRKGIHTLLQAYQDYRRQVEKPWELWCVGRGPLQTLLENQPGIRLIEFTPPDQCAQLMAQAGTFVIASEWDHWGVVLHEAACAGLPLIASRQCRATVELLQDGFNGYTFNAGDAARLSQLLLQCGMQPNLAEWGANSLKLAGRLSPEIFAWQLRQNIPAALGRIQ